MSLRRSPLDAAHRALGAKLCPFGGWEMPIAYPAGTLAEHMACRQHAVVFDVSHLGTVRVAGPGAYDRLQAALTNDLAKIGPGRAQYTHLLDESDASVLDDIIVWWVEPERFDVMPNASNTARVLDALAGPGASVADRTDDRAVLAVQGPDARALLARLVGETAAVSRFSVRPFSWEGLDCLVAGTGYTGEDGVEIAVPAEGAETLFNRLVEAGVQPAGLGARDTLRLEAGLPLHGHELGPGITPLQAGLGWVVAWAKGPFRGREPLTAEKERGVDRLLRGLRTESRQPPREGYEVHRDGAVIGKVTSGNFSPVVGTGVAMAFLPPDIGPGADVTIDARGREMAARVVELPFVGRSGQAQKGRA